MGYSKLKGRLSTRYSPVRHFTHQPKPTFSYDLHVLGTPPAFILSQNQTLQLRITHKSNLVAHKTLIQVLFAPTRYLFVKDPLAFRQEETSLSTHLHTVKRFLQALSNFLCRSVLRKGRVNLLTLHPSNGQPLLMAQ